MMSDEQTPGVEVPWEQLDPATLHRVLEEFVTREGTDYGEQAHTLAEKVAQVHVQLKCGEAMLTFDPATESIDLVARRR